MSPLKKPNLLPRTRYGYGALLFVLSMTGYMFLYTGRGTLSASIPGIVAEGVFTKDMLGGVGTVFFIIYGVMQAPFGMLADRVKPHIMMTAGLLGAAVFTFLTGLSIGTIWMYVFWGVNGLVQSSYWPALVKAVAEILPADQRVKGSMSLALSGPIGALGLYVTSAVVFSFTGWRQLFIINSVLLALSSVMVFFGLRKTCGYLKSTENEDPLLRERAREEKAPVVKVSTVWLLLRSGVVFLLMPCMTFGIIREGINMWAPTLLVEMFHVTSVKAMLLSTFLPLIAAFAVPLAIFLLKKADGRELRVSMLCHAMTIVMMAVVLFFGASFGPAVCIILLALITAMQGVTSSVTMGINAQFGRYNKTGTMIGIFNMCIFAGNAIVSFLMGWVSQHFGWNSALWIWMVAAVLGLVFTAIENPRWERFKKETAAPCKAPAVSDN